MGSRALKEELIMTVVCETMSWTYKQYLEQPTWFIKLLLLKLGADAEHQNKLNKKHGTSSNIGGGHYRA